MDKRVILIVLDSAGIGALPDAADFGDEGSNTFGNIYAKRGKLELPNLYSLGLSCIEGSGLPAYSGKLRGSYARAAEKTHAKDTTCGHWEMMGIIMETPFKTYPNGFPKRIIDEFEQKIGRGTLGNCVASGTEIIQRLGDEHVKTGKPIVYTSADSVFQIAADEDVIPLDELYRICQIAREMLVGDDLVGRVIARPFIKAEEGYKRTENRKDYAVPPIRETVLDALSARGCTTVGVGKIEDIFCKRGVDVVDHTKNNPDGIDATLRLLRDGTGRFIFTNLVDFDMLYGHRNDVEGYASALEYFDSRLPEIMKAMRDEDLLIITADHGCDPTTASTDHSREYIPVMVYSPSLKGGVDMGTLGSFADIGSSVFDYLTGSPWDCGDSFIKKLS